MSDLELYQKLINLSKKVRSQFLDNRLTSEQYVTLHDIGLQLKKLAESLLPQENE